MKYSKAYIEAIAYELPPIVVTSEEIETRLAPLYKKLHFPEGQLEALTGIKERRWWEPGFSVSQGAITAARKAIWNSNIDPKEIDILIYGAVCREAFEPATACSVAASLGINSDAMIYDISNACLGVMNGIIDVANRIELGHSRAGLVVSCESAREINELTIKRMLQNGTMEYFIGSLATLTGGSGAVAVLLTDGSFTGKSRRKLLGGVSCAAPEYHQLCKWGVYPLENGDYEQVMKTDSIGILKNGVELGKRTWDKFLKYMEWDVDRINKTIAHQVGESHRSTVLAELEISDKKDFFTYPFLGNIGTVSLPITAAIAEERDFLKPGDNVGFLGIGSGLNCMILGWEW
jgi:acyl-CoA:acyl-CoA alkyltransferase